MANATKPATVTEVAAQRFPKDVADHELTILRDDGLYRHLRCAQPGTGSYWFEIVTWPGALAIRGDAGDGYLFSRIDDMLEFFRRPDQRINPQYWAEKLGQGCRRVEVYSEDVLCGTPGARMRHAAHGQQCPACGPAARRQVDSLRQVAVEAGRRIVEMHAAAEHAAARHEAERQRLRSLLDEADDRADQAQRRCVAAADALRAILRHPRIDHQVVERVRGFLAGERTNVGLVRVVQDRREAA